MLNCNAALHAMAYIGSLLKEESPLHIRPDGSQIRIYKSTPFFLHCIAALHAMAYIGSLLKGESPLHIRPDGSPIEQQNPAEFENTVKQQVRAASPPPLPAQLLLFAACFFRGTVQAQSMSSSLLFMLRASLYALLC